MPHRAFGIYYRAMPQHQNFNPLDFIEKEGHLTSFCPGSKKLI